MFSLLNITIFNFVFVKVLTALLIKKFLSILFVLLIKNQPSQIV